MIEIFWENYCNIQKQHKCVMFLKGSLIDFDQ